MTTDTYRRLGPAADVPPGAAKTYDVDGKGIAVFNDGGAYLAVAAACPHRGGPLGEGSLEGGVLTCPWHGWSFDARTGAGVRVPGSKVACFAVKVEAGDLFVSFDK